MNSSYFELRNFKTFKAYYCQILGIIKIAAGTRYLSLNANDCTQNL